MKPRTIIYSLVLLVCVGAVSGQQVAGTPASASADPAALAAASGAAGPADAAATTATCRTYTVSDPAAAPVPATEPVVSSVPVTDADFLPASVAVSGVNIAHQRVGGLKARGRARGGAVGGHGNGAAAPAGQLAEWGA